MAVVKAILPPKDMFYVKAFEAAVKRAANEAIRAMDSDFKATTATWQTKVRFTKRIKTRAGDITLSVTTSNKIYAYVDKGTKPHIIRAKRAKYLRFQSGYRAKTTPRKIRSRNGGKSGGYLYRKSVKHPGLTAREFTTIIQDKHTPLWINTVRAIVLKYNVKRGK